MDNSAADSLPPNDHTQEIGVHLWIPEHEARDSTSDAAPSTSRPPQLLRERLYVGNLSPTVDEYALLQVFAKFGKISKLDFLFHKSGPNKGKPRGYAFVEYMHDTDAAKALQTTNGKVLRGRKLVVTFAHQAPSHDSGWTSRNKRADATPTALSLAKSSGIARPEAKTSSKIAMMEAKLRQMASSSAIAQRPALPSKPAPPRGVALTAAVAARGKNDSGQVAHGRPSSLRDAECPELIRIPPSSRQRSIPGVKIVKGQKGTCGITP